MKALRILALIAILSSGMALVGCGDKNKKTESEEVTLKLTPESTEISGDMMSCFEIIDREYSVKMEEILGGIITVELTRTDMDLPFSLDEADIEHFGVISSAENIQVGFGIELLDKDGNILDKTSANEGGLAGPYSTEECVALVKLKPGQKGSIRFRVSEDAKDAVKFRITSAYVHNDGSSYSDNSDEVEVIDITDDDSDSDVSESKSTSSNSDTDWDDVLDSYESFSKEYIPFCEKVADGSVTITSPEYARMMRQSSDFSSKLAGARGDMTPSQWARYMKISGKIAQAAQKIR